MAQTARSHPSGDSGDDPHSRVTADGMLNPWPAFRVETVQSTSRKETMAPGLCSEPRYSHKRSRGSLSPHRVVPLAAHATQRGYRCGAMARRSPGERTLFHHRCTPLVVHTNNRATFFIAEFPSYGA